MCYLAPGKPDCTIASLILVSIERLGAVNSFTLLSRTEPLRPDERIVVRADMHLTLSETHDVKERIREFLNANARAVGSKQRLGSVKNQGDLLPIS